MVTLLASVVTSAVMVLIVMMPHLVNGSRVLLTPFPWGSHVAELAAIGEGLADNGHDVYILLPPVFPGIEKMKKSQLKVIEYVRKESDFFDMSLEDDFFDAIVNITEVTDFRTNVEGFIQICTNVLGDENLFKTLQSLKFDIGIVDVFPSSRCYLALLYRLGVPYVSVTTTYEPWLFRNPALPSFVPFPMADVFSDRMDFKERLLNMWNLLDWTIDPRTATIDDNLVTTYAPEKPAVSMNYLATRSLMWLFDTDVVLDYPRPVMPNEINIGGLTTRASNPLPQDLENILENVATSVVLVSFGSSDLIPLELCNKMMDAFKQLKHLHFIWRYRLDFPDNVSSHITLRKWLPQNDLLGNPKIKLFITHGGANSQFESLYHSVPMITFPIFGDQPYNARRTQSKGVAITMNVHTFSADDLTKNILHMASNNSYQTKIEKLSKIYRSRPMSAKQRAVYWIEHVLEYGGDHLMSSALDMPWYEYLMLDIAALIITIMIIIICIFYKLLSMTIYRLAFSYKSKQKKE